MPFFFFLFFLSIALIAAVRILKSHQHRHRLTAPPAPHKNDNDTTSTTSEPLPTRGTGHGGDARGALLAPLPLLYQTDRRTLPSPPLNVPRGCLLVNTKHKLGLELPWRRPLQLPSLLSASPTQNAPLSPLPQIARSLYVGVKNSEEKQYVKGSPERV